MLCNTSRTSASSNVDDVKEGIMASKIAAHAADIAKGVKGAMDWDNQMAAARQKLDWEKQFELALDPEKARRYPCRINTRERRYMYNVWKDVFCT